VDENLDPVVAAIAAYGLTTRLRLPEHHLDDPPFDAVLVAARRARVLGMLTNAVADGAFPVTNAQRDRCAALEQAWAGQALHLERLLLEVTSVLERAAVRYRVFKGPALAHTVYPHPGWRVFADLDVLVPGAAFARARDAILEDLDAVQPIPELAPGFDGEFGKDAPLRVGQLEIDLHRTFASGPFGLTIPLDELFVSAAHLVLGGRAVPTLPPSAAFLQACVNAALGDLPVRACSLRDVVQLSTFVEDDVDAIMATAQRWGIGIVVHRAVDLAWPSLGLAPGPFTEWAERYRASPREQWFLRSYLTPARSYTRPAASLFVIKGVGPRVRYARALLFPQRTYLTSRGWRLGHHARRALDALRSTLSRHG
jgi:hypothetical protein